MLLWIVYLLISRKMDGWCLKRITNMNEYYNHLRFRRLAIFMSLVQYVAFGGCCIAFILKGTNKLKILVSLIALILTTIGFYGALKVNYI